MQTSPDLKLDGSLQHPLKHVLFPERRIGACMNYCAIEARNAPLALSFWRHWLRGAEEHGQEGPSLCKGSPRYQREQTANKPTDNVSARPSTLPTTGMHKECQSTIIRAFAAEDCLTQTPDPDPDPSKTKSK